MEKQADEKFGNSWFIKFEALDGALARHSEEGTPETTLELSMERISISCKRKSSRKSLIPLIVDSIKYRKLDTQK